jgi:L-rhamnonate dehydratase
MTTITHIEWAVLEGQRPRSAGSNARLGDHGPVIRDSMARITTADGATGFGYSRLTREQAEKLLGQALDDLITLPQGVTEAGRPLEFPLWDLLGQQKGQPVYALAGGAEPPHAPCYDTTLYFDDLHLALDEDAVQLIVAEAQAGYARGHRAFKLKVGRGALHMSLNAGTKRDIAIIRGVREALGPAVTLMIDANNGYNYNLTRQVLEATAECDIYWMEEPFHEDPVLYGHLHDWLREKNLKVLIADGEGWAAPRLMDWAQQGHIDVVQYDIRDIGFSRWLATGRLLDAWDVKSAPHNYGSHYGNFVSCHLAGVIRDFTFAEWDIAAMPALDASGYVLDEGIVQVPSAPGFGLKLDDKLFTAAVKTGGFEVSA